MTNAGTNDFETLIMGYVILTIFDPRSSIVKSVCGCHISGAILMTNAGTNDFETLIMGYVIIPGVR